MKDKLITSVPAERGNYTSCPNCGYWCQDGDRNIVFKPESSYVNADGGIPIKDAMFSVGGKYGSI